MTPKIVHTLNVLGLIGVLVVNFLASYLPIGGFTTGELSDKYNSLFTPAGFTFSIWGIIYLALIAWTVFVAWGLYRGSTSSDRILNLIGPWFVINCIANASWIFVWHYQYILLSLLFMFIIWLSLFQIYRAIDVAWLENDQQTAFTVGLPFSIYFGWISVALIANISVYLKSMEWGGFGVSEPLWTMIIMAIVGVLGLYVLWKERDRAFVLVFAWALWGISKSQASADYNQIGQTALIICAILLVGILYSIYARWRFGRK
ncbi:MAG: tryptophan-rich sensory protein [Saprospiraceae bacterium]|nr:tryptophan-rich sensory protein [Saprospiraceae bacterium]